VVAAKPDAPEERTTAASLREALGRRSLELELAILELEIDPDDLS
jgi:hypothetical protein